MVAGARRRSCWANPPTDMKSRFVVGLILIVSPTSRVVHGAARNWHQGQKPAGVQRWEVRGTPERHVRPASR